MLSCRTGSRRTTALELPDLRKLAAEATASTLTIEPPACESCLNRCGLHSRCLSLCPGRTEDDGRFGRQNAEGEAFLKVQLDGRARMAEVAN